MSRLALLALAGLGLAGCQSLTPAQDAALFCVVSADGVVIGQAVTKGGAQATAQKLGAAQPIACDTAVRIGQVLAPPTAKP